MRTTVCEEAGKLESTSTLAGVDVNQTSRRLCIIDTNLREKFLIDTGAYISVLSARNKKLPPDRYKAAKLEFEHMMEMGICKPSNSPWASPLHVVKKKDGSLRVCGDYRRLNAVTVPDRCPIPRIQDFTYQLHGKKIFSKLDLKMPYFWIPIAKEDAQKTAIIINPFGLFEFNCMTFGLRNSGQTFQRFMHEVLRGLDDIAFCYIEDLLVHSKNQDVHRRHIEIIIIIITPL